MLEEMKSPNNQINFRPSRDSLKTIIGNGKYYQVPAYQRDYSWEKDQWEDLWEDIVMVYEQNEEHYMGNLVLKTINKEEFEVIDGQQRLITVSLLILALSHLMLEKSGGELAEEIKKSFLTRRQAGKILFLPKLSLNKNNQDYFNILINSSYKPTKSQSKNNSDKLIFEAFDYYYEQSKKYFEQKTAEDIDIFINIFTRDLVFIQIFSDSYEKAFDIFETLNSRGLSLSSTDLIKNHIFGLTGEIKIAISYWSNIHSTLDGEIAPFIKHFLNTQFADKVRDKDVFKRFRKKYNTPEKVVNFLETGNQLVSFYSALDDPESQFWIENYPSNKKLIKNLLELKLFGVSQYKSIALAVYQEIQDEMSTILNYIKNITFRYNTICSKNPNDIETVYGKLAFDICQKKVTTKEEILERLKAVYVDDEEFSVNFEKKNFNFIARNKKIINYILHQIELNLKNSSNKSEITDTYATIEHILPQNAENNDYNFNENQKMMIMNSLPNLTLLEFSKNKNIGNSSFESKRNSYEHSDYILTKKLANYSNWDMESVKNRAIFMSNQACHIWKI